MEGTRVKSVGKRTVQRIDSIVNIAVLTFFFLLFSYGSYALWDSNQLYQEAQMTQYEKYKPINEDTLSFEELQKVNSDVFGWLTVYGTNIDYPLLQTDNDETYINTNAKGEYSLAGSIFLDYRNHNDFSDFNSIIFGHHMDNNVMFGEIGNFKELNYFNDHKYGRLFFNKAEHGIEFFAFLEVDAYDSTVYVPPVAGNQAKQSYLANLEDKAMYYREIMLGMNEQLVLLSTCTSDSTNGRHVLVGRITDKVFENNFTESKTNKKNVDIQSVKNLFAEIPVWLWYLVSSLLVIFILVMLMNKKKKKKRRK